MIELIEQLGYEPMQCVWELTLACNMHCLHCGSYAGRSRDGELGWEECKSVADQLAALGCKKVTLGGGEPTLHPRWHEIGRRLSDRGVRVNIITNGWSWSAEHVEKARWAGLVNVAFSLDGFEEAHDRVRRQGSFQRVMRAVRLCLDNGTPVATVTHVNRLNYRSLPELRAFQGEQGVSSWQLQLGNPEGHMSQNEDLVIPEDDLLWLIPLVAELRTDGVERPIVCPGDNIGYYGVCEKGLRDRGARVSWWVGCRAGCHVIGIESNGNVKGCLSLPSARHGEDRFLEGNLREHDLRTLWTRPGAFAYNRGFTVDQLGGFCRVCRYGDICRGGCAWTAYSHSRNRFDNRYCFYRLAVKHRRFDLLGEDEPNAAELAFFEPEQDRTERDQTFGGG